MLLNPEDGLYRGGVTLRLEKSEGHQVGPEIRARLGYGFTGMSTPWGTAGLAGTYGENAAAFRQQSAQRKDTPAAAARNREIELLRIQGTVASVIIGLESEGTAVENMPQPGNNHQPGATP